MRPKTEMKHKLQTKQLGGAHRTARDDLWLELELELELKLGVSSVLGRGGARRESYDMYVHT